MSNVLLFIGSASLLSGLSELVTQTEMGYAGDPVLPFNEFDSEKKHAYEKPIGVADRQTYVPIRHRKSRRW